MDKKQEKGFVKAGYSTIQGELIMCTTCFTIIKSGKDKCYHCGKKVKANALD